MARKDNKEGLKLWVEGLQIASRGSEGRMHNGLGRGGRQQHLTPNSRVRKEGNTLDGQWASGDLFGGCKKFCCECAAKRGERSYVRQSCSKET